MVTCHTCAAADLVSGVVLTCVACVCVCLSVWMCSLTALLIRLSAVFVNVRRCLHFVMLNVPCCVSACMMRIVRRCTSIPSSKYIVYFTCSCWCFLSDSASSSWTVWRQTKPSRTSLVQQASCYCSILHHRPVLLHCHTLILDQLLTFLAASSTPVFKHHFSQSFRP